MQSRIVIRCSLGPQLFAFEFKIDTGGNRSLQSSLRPFYLEFLLTNGDTYTLWQCNRLFSYTRHKIISNFRLLICQLDTLTPFNRQSAIGNLNKSAPTVLRRYSLDEQPYHSSTPST